ncbi:hypothetical protein [Magnetospirillum sp. 15-1]|uniref:hypothetical protein n=1 Tax=Magnetospirillum sp. 15-1 TaxID=1979370 RepID=UPI001F5B5DA2|nr:hypothetical protein [Magnetospirillum sp. 15-1]
MLSSTFFPLSRIVRRILGNWNRSTPRSWFPLSLSRPTAIRLGRHRPLLLSSAVLLALVAVQMAAPGQTEPPSGRRGPPAGREQPVFPMAEWPAITARPLFTPSRRPAPPRASEGSSLDGYAVLGIGLMESQATAVVRTPAGKPVRLLSGQRLEGWTLAGIEPKTLVFEKDGVSRTLSLDAKRLRTVPAPAGGRPKGAP